MVKGELDHNRRNFLRLVLIGAGVLAVGKIFGPRLLEAFSSNEVTVKNFKDFTTEEKNKKELTVYDKTGEAIFVIDDKK